MNFDDILEGIGTSLYQDAFTLGAGSILNKVAKAGSTLLGTTKKVSANAASNIIRPTISNSAALMDSSNVLRFSSKTASAFHVFAIVGQKGPFFNQFLKTTTEETVKKAREVIIKDSASKKGVYANGKLFVVRGGPKGGEYGNTILQPLGLELYEENKKLAMQKCMCSFILFVT